MATRLELAEKKLDRLNNEFSEQKSPMAGAEFGQPIVMNSQGKRIVKQLEKHQERMFNRLHEIQKQEERVEHLRYKEHLAEQGKDGRGNWIYSVDNLPRLEAELERKEKIREELKARGEWRSYNQTSFRNFKKRVEALKEQVNQSEKVTSKINKAMQTLISEGAVSQWKKKPKYYFVKGLKKVALEYSEEKGGFIESPRYPAKDEEEREVLEVFRECGAIV